MVYRKNWKKCSLHACVFSRLIIFLISTDGTQALVRHHLRALPGRLLEEPFRDYGYTRNRVLNAINESADAEGQDGSGGSNGGSGGGSSSSGGSGGSGSAGLEGGRLRPVFVLTLSADETLVNGREMRAFLEVRPGWDGGLHAHSSIRLREVKWR